MQLGNDIVDLRIDADIHPRFLERVLHPDERLLYPGIAEDPLLVWTLWAAKESAFKAFRQSSMRFFLPNRWRVDLKASRVQFETQSWILGLQASAEAVWATSASTDFPFVTEMRSSEVELSPREQSAWGRALLEDLLERYAPAAIYHKDEGGVPRLKQNGQPIPFSMSHHGRHVHVCLALP